jgi:hypothetical protein
LKGEHAWTLTATDVYLGWTENVAIRNRAHSRVVAAIEEAAGRLPYPMVGLDCDNGGEFINHALVAWCAERAIFMTRARAHTSNDNAHVEQKNGDIVRKSAFRYRYDTPEELALLNELWGYVNLRKNLFLPTTKANGWRTTKAGRNTRTYDKPRTPYRRLLDSGVRVSFREHLDMRHYAARRDSSKWIELPVISVDRLGESQTTAHGRVILCQRGLSRQACPYQFAFTRSQCVCPGVSADFLQPAALSPIRSSTDRDLAICESVPCRPLLDRQRAGRGKRIA